MDARFFFSARFVLGRQAMASDTAGSAFVEHTDLAWPERILTTCLVLLKLEVLYRTWGKMQGFDAQPWIDVFHVTRWFNPLPDVKSLFNGYHPPLSFLMGRLVYAVYPHEVEASQILSTLSVIGAVFALRSTLRTLGILWTLPGLALLFVTASLPLVVWLGIETSYDPVVFMWFSVALATSVGLFWNPPPPHWWRSVRYASTVGLLAVTFAAGMLTKFNMSLAFGLPFLVIATRRGLRGLFRELGAPCAAVAIGAAIVAPFYYSRYYAPLGEIFPSNMEWERAGDLAKARAVRDAGRGAFLLHILRIPEQPVSGGNKPLRDSLIHSVWLQLWKRDGDLGWGEPQGALSLAVSDLYGRIFGIFIPVSTLILCFERRKLPSVWRQLGTVFLTIAGTYCAALVCFGFKYPLWDWAIFKAKYVSPAAFWIAYCAVLPFVRRSSSSAVTWRWQGAKEVAAVTALLVFMFLNHVLPVY